MLLIGEFSKVCNVSVQTLRYYDKIGVLKADYTDDLSGYRFYSPEKVKTYQKIEQLKQLGFSLDEIRQFLSCSQTEQYHMYGNRKRIINDEIVKKQEQIKLIDSLCENPDSGLIPLNLQIMSVKFEDDPAVIGKWEYCGNLTDSRKFNGKNKLTKLPVYDKNLYFLPGGENVWTYFWTKGVLYHILHEYNVIVPNEYRILKINEDNYMEIHWMTSNFIEGSSENGLRIYRQTDDHAYSERETFAFCDEVDLPFTVDEHVVGDWETVDIISDIADFTCDPDKWYKDPFWILGMSFFERGVCVITYSKNGNREDIGYKYTAGAVLNLHRKTAQHYWIKHDRDDYLIMEHKSGDYSYLGTVQCYYVFRRKTK